MTHQHDLNEAKIAILATNGFEQSELFSPKKAMDEAGATTEVISLEAGEIRGWKHGEWGESVAVDKTIDEAKVDDYDGLILPGGVINPDKLRRSKAAVEFVRQFFAEHKPVAAICHGPQLLIDAGVLEGRRVTSFHSIKQDLINAGAHWEDSEVVCDQGLVTSRTPDDLEAFNAKAMEEISEGRHAGQTV